VVILECLCKDFLKTVIVENAFSIRLSTLKIEAKVAPMPIETLQARYDELLKSFAEMRNNYTREIMHHKEGRIARLAHNAAPVNAHFFDDLKYLTQQYIHF
jgi:hypothetical protein